MLGILLGSPALAKLLAFADQSEAFGAGLSLGPIGRRQTGERPPRRAPSLEIRLETWLPLPGAKLDHLGRFAGNDQLDVVRPALQCVGLVRAVDGSIINSCH